MIENLEIEIQCVWLRMGIIAIQGNVIRRMNNFKSS